MKTQFHFQPNFTKQRGYVLITSLIFLTVLTLVAVVSSRSTTFEYQMSSNLVLKDRAFQSSETGRTGMASILDAHIFEREWNDSVKVPPGLNVLDKDSNGDPDLLFITNNAGEDLYNPTTMVTDAQYKIDANADGDFDDGGDVNSDINVYKTKSVAARGAGTAMVAGYEGLGKGMAGGGFHVYFELRSQGKSIVGAQANTASEYRVVVRN